MGENHNDEVISAEPVSNSSEFAKRLISKGIPVNLERAQEVGQMLFDTGATSELVGKISNCFRFIGKREFDEDVKKLAKQISEDFSGKPYNLILFGRRKKSSDWLLDQLKPYNVLKPTSKLNVDQLWGNLHKLKRPSIFIDEWSLSGEQISGVAEHIQGAAEYGESGSGLGFRPEVHSYMLYAQSGARKVIEESGARTHVISQEPITNLFDITTPNEREILRKVKIDQRGWKQDVHVRPTTTLTFGWWKIPDSFYELFINPSPLGLINIEDFYPPYKDKSLLTKASPNGRLITPF